MMKVAHQCIYMYFDANHISHSFKGLFNIIDSYSLHVRLIENIIITLKLY